MLNKIMRAIYEIQLKGGEPHTIRISKNNLIKIIKDFNLYKDGINITGAELMGLPIKFIPNDDFIEITNAEGFYGAHIDLRDEGIK